MPRYKILLSLLAFLVIGFYFRFSNLSPFTFYPDSYQNLIVAENIRNVGSVVGTLGSEGLVYPPFFIWTRPIYPLLINFVIPLNHDPFLSAQLISFFSGVLAILLVYVLLNRIFGSPQYGLAASFILAFSYQHTLWSGFIMTETVGIVMMLLFLISLFFTLKRSSVFADPYDILTGILFTFAVFTRYEYILVLLPVIFIIIKNTSRPGPRLITMGSAFLIASALFLTTLFPLASLLDIILFQLPDLMIRGAIIVTALISTAGFYLYHKKTAGKYSRHVLIIVTVILLVSTIFMLQLPTGVFVFSKLIHTSLPFVLKFVQKDLLLIFLSSIGFYLLFRNLKTRILAIFTALSCLVLLLIYQRINPEMERYLTHLIPFLIIPASYALTTILTQSKKTTQSLYRYALIIFLLCLFFQAGLTRMGLLSTGDSTWYELSYELKAAQLVKPYVPNPEIIILTSLPEPYYLTLHHTTQSIADMYPYIYLPSRLNDQEVLIIQDMGMHDLFPQFNKLLQDNFQDVKIAEFSVHAQYRFEHRTEPEKYPIVLYKTTLKDLKNRLDRAESL